MNRRGTARQILILMRAVLGRFIRIRVTPGIDAATDQEAAHESAGGPLPGRTPHGPADRDIPSDEAPRG